MPGLGKLAGKAFRAGLRETHGPAQDIFATAKPLRGEPKSWLKQIAQQGPAISYKLPSNKPVHFDYPGYVIVEHPEGQFLINQRAAKELGVNVGLPASDTTLDLDTPVHDDLGEPDIMKALGVALGVGAGAAGAATVQDMTQKALYGRGQRKDR